MPKELHPDWYYEVEGMRTLILGTFPPHPRKRNYPFYYPNNQNRFWKIMAEIAGTSLAHKEGAPAVEERKKLMKRLKVGVQNMGKAIQRKGKSSLDQDIVIVEFQDLLKIVRKHDTLKTILLTGYSAKSSTYHSFVRYLRDQGIEPEGLPESPGAGLEFTFFYKRSITCILGNSTSGAAFGVPFKRLVEQFRRALKIDS